MARAAALSLLAACACAIGGCVMPAACLDLCDAQERECVDESTDPGQQVVCANRFDQCLSSCPPGEP